MATELPDEWLAPNFMLSEFLVSETAVRRGIDNTPSGYVLHNLREHTGPGLQRIRNLLNRVARERQPDNSAAHGVIITSGYRCPDLNMAVGGSRNSQHIAGLAGDFITPSWGTPREAALAIADHYDDIQFDQLIMEGNWVHVSFAEHPRGSILTATFGAAGVPSYSRGVV